MFFLDVDSGAGNERVQNAGSSAIGRYTGEWNDLYKHFVPSINEALSARLYCRYMYLVYRRGVKNEQRNGHEFPDAGAIHARLEVAAHSPDMHTSVLAVTARSRSKLEVTPLAVRLRNRLSITKKKTNNREKKSSAKCATSLVCLLI